METNQTLQIQCPDITILIRAKNEEKLFGRCLEMIFSQQLSLGFEVLLIDSGSTDRTVAIARRYSGVHIEQIPPGSFNFGETLNLGVRKARGRFVVPLSAHCIPVDENWLRCLVHPLLIDDRIGASFSRQIPWPDCEPVERNFLENIFGPQDYLIGGIEAFQTPLDPLFSNASSCLRRDLVCEIPFQRLSFCEDRVWAFTVLQAGYQLAYCSQSVVFHSHQRNIRQYFSLGYHNGATLAQLGLPGPRIRDFDWVGCRNLYWTLGKWIRINKKQGLASAQIPLKSFQSLFRHIAQDIGTWLGHKKNQKTAFQESKEKANGRKSFSVPKSYFQRY